MAEVTCKCDRCGVRLKLSVGNPDARFIRLADKPSGYCLNCVVTKFFKTSEMTDAMQCSRKIEPGLPEAFRLPHIQECFASVLRVGLSDADPKDIDWLEVIANWALPFPKSDHGAGKTLWS